MKKIDTLWLIPARGGSKGIPKKNIKPFCGSPLVTLSIEQAKECASGDDVILVSTDSPEIKEVSEKCGISIPFLRPEEVSTDTASSYSVIMHALKEFAARGITFEKVVLLQPTSPLRTVEDIRTAVNRWTPDTDMVVTVSKARTNPYYNAFETDDNGYLHISKGPGTYTRRQDAPKVWEYNGAVYVMSVESLDKMPMNQFKRILPSPMSSSRSVDLDTPEDWIIAETIYKKQNAGNQ